MDFCDECGGMLVSQKQDGQTVMECRDCGHVQDVDGGDYKVTEEKEDDPMDRLNVNEEGGEESTRPTTKKECKKCGEETEQEWWMEQTRASDEPATRFYKCRECGNVYKEYD
ncbi:transcription factor S [Candidatus Nanohalovita haloferacivicina]|uniref:transcription factor S n=1 Tax=Candidatus Nanohalovita haloferacivicina TaxID=2978046 RepID=UPI00325FC444|nr:Transcription termination factor TFS [Candidatus Nanohalobia archaeon BNXNv]